MESELRTGKEDIDGGEWTNCWFCEHIFRRRRQTLRYCYHCHKGFCEGEHGSFAAAGGRPPLAVCVNCWKPRPS